MEYDAIVVGSGFGGTVAVSKLVGRGKRVLLLERGTWWTTPERLGSPPAPAPPDLAEWAAANKQAVQYFPRPDHTEGLIDLFASVRYSGNRDGLYVYSQFDECNVLHANGVGGGSLIYSTATMRPEQAVLDQIGLTLTDRDYAAARRWTETKRGLLNNIVTKIPLPPGKNVEDLGAEDYLYLDRSRLLRDAALTVRKKRRLGSDQGAWGALELAIGEYHASGAGNRESAAAHTFCERQGRCILGCLPNATHSLDKTLFREYLSRPSGGVTLWPQVEVRTVRAITGGWEVALRDYRADGDERTVSAPQVYLAAGTLGTNEVLLRSRDRGLALSESLGHGFSTNGNFAGFCVGTANPAQPTRGPMNTCHVDFHVDGRQIIVEDCAIPAMAAKVAGIALRLLDDWGKRELFKGAMHLAWATKALPDLTSFLPHLPDTHNPSDFRTEMEAVADVFCFNAMSQDDANGTFTLDDDELDLKWDEPLTKQPVFEQVEALVQDLAAAMASDDPASGYVPMPTWRGFEHKLSVTHPLGGCRIAANSADGVVDAYGRVFDGSEPSGSRRVLPGLFVVDASVIPGAVVAHPTLTITAQALKTMRKALA